MRARRLWLALLAAAVLLMLAGCGAVGGNDCADLASSPPTRAGDAVQIATDHTAYPANGVIHVTVTNNRATPIYAYDEGASCTILQLQTRVNEQWQAPPKPIAGCPLGRPSMLVEVASGASYSGTVAAGYLRPNDATFPAGDYRLTLTYFTSRVPDAAGGTTVTSATLTVRDCAAATPTVGGSPIPAATGGSGTAVSGTAVAIPPVRP